MQLNKTLLFMAMTSVLTGCGGSDKSDKASPPVVKKNSLVCVDTNQNARCDAGELSEKVARWSNQGMSTSLNSGQSPLVYEGDDGAVFVAPAGSSILSPESAIVASELIYNQVIETKTNADVERYLQGKLGTEILNSTQEADFLAVLNTAFSSHPDASRYAVIAAVVEKVIVGGSGKLDRLKDITVSTADIKAADRPSLAKLTLSSGLSKNVDDKVAQQKADGWVDAGDASISVLSAKNGKIIGGSHYHNALTVIDVAAGSVTHSPVSVLTDAGHGKDSSTGASENYLRDVKFNLDASYAYVNIPPKHLSSSTMDDHTFGLYKVKLESDGSIATISDGKMIKIDESESTRLAKKLTGFSVSGDGNQVVTYDADEFLTVYDSDLANAGSAVLSEGIKAFVAGNNQVFTVTENVDDKAKADLNALPMATLKPSTTLTLDFVPQELLLSQDGNKLLAFTHGHDHEGVMNVALIDLTKNSVLEQATFNSASDTAAVSDDFSKLAIVGHEDSRLMIVNLTVPSFSIQHVYELAYNARDVAFIDNDQLAIIDGRNSLGVIDIETTTDNLSMEEKTKLALNSLNKATMNGGGYFDAVVKDLSLSKSYENIAISWSADTSLDGNLTLPDGTVTRPTAGETDATGVLTARTKLAFRDDTVTDEKEFSLSIRKVPNALPAPVSIKTAKNYVNYMAVNHQGDLMVAPVEFEAADKTERVGFNTISFNAGVATITSGTEDIPKTYRDTESLVGVGLFEGTANHYAIGVSEALGDTGRARIFSVLLNAGTLAEAETHSIDITAGTPVRVSSNTAQSLFSVMIEKADKSFVTQVYSIDESGALSLQQSINMTAAEYKWYGPHAINDDATRVYQRDGDRVIMTATNGSTASVAVEEVARVWFYNERVLATTYDGNIISFNADLEESSRKTFSTGTGGRLYGGVGRMMNGKHYFYIPVQRAEESINGIYQLEMLADGSLKEIAFSAQAEGADRMAVSGDGDTVFFTYRVRSGDKEGRWVGVVGIN